MTEMATDKRKVNQDGNVTLEGKRLEDVQKEKLNNSIDLADKISVEQFDGAQFLKDEHYMKLCEFKIKAEDLEKKLKDVSIEAQQYGMSIAADYGMKDGDRFVISLLERTIKKA